MRIAFVVLAVLGSIPAEVFADGAPPPNPPVGLARRVPWTTSRVVGSPDPPLPYRAVRAFEALTLARPLYVENEPGTDRLLVVQQDGKILRFRNDPQATDTDVETFLDTGREAYGLTFHPDYAANGYIYVVSNGPREAEVKQDRVSRFTVSREAPFACDRDSELVIIEWESNGHNGGDVAFGPDGFLYIPAGDGSVDSDTNDTGQDISNVNATLMRIDVDHPDKDRPYSIPPDNPFIETEGARPEIWAYGFRNPWRLTFDEKTGHLWVANIGQDLWEMIHLVRRGENYGWSAFEGSHEFHELRKRGPTPVVKPTIEHSHAEARSITGGIVYYGARFPDLHGAYLYGDYSTGKIWAARHDGTKLTFHQEIADTSVQILGFGTDPQGNVLIVDYTGGLYQLEPMPEQEPQHPFPTKLSETGLFLSTADHTPDPALIPYSVNAELWSDGAGKQRFIALPRMKTIHLRERGGWDFPDGAVLVKTFSLPTDAAQPETQQRIETRLMTRQQGEWVGYTYQWNDEQTDAELVSSAGLDRVFRVADPEAVDGIREQTWHYPSRAECMVCHSRAANYVLGLSTVQMNKLHDYGPATENQLQALERVGAFRSSWGEVDPFLQKLTQPVRTLMEPDRAKLLPLSAAITAPLVRGERLARALLDPFEPRWARPLRRGGLRLTKAFPSWFRRRVPEISLLPKRPDEYEALANPYDESQPLEVRARSYLHANCSICHVEAGGGNSRIKLDFFTPRTDMALIDTPPVHESFGVTNPQVVASGAPQQSVLLRRLAVRGRGQMPPLATSRVDRRAVEMLEEWVKSLGENAAVLKE